MNTSELKQLGELLHAHRWRDGGEWAEAIGRLARLSDADVLAMVRLSGAPGEPRDGAPPRTAAAAPPCVEACAAGAGGAVAGGNQIPVVPDDRPRPAVRGTSQHAR